MIVPVRCFSCGKVIAEEYEEFLKKKEKGMSAEKAFEELGIERYCCRRMITSHVDLMDDLLKYNV
jgi:DNA-directed RNA polymerase subunit N